jgi:hypothetical protein
MDREDLGYHDLIYVSLDMDYWWTCVCVRVFPSARADDIFGTKIVKNRWRSYEIRVWSISKGNPITGLDRP